MNTDDLKCCGWCTGKNCDTCSGGSWDCSKFEFNGVNCCYNCKHISKDEAEYPCSHCNYEYGNYDRWEATK